MKDSEKKGEVIQQVVEKARKIICGFGDDGSDSHWLVSIVINRSTNQLGVFRGKAVDCVMWSVEEGVELCGYFP